MKIVRPYARMMPPAGQEGWTFLIPTGIDLLRHVEFAARVSHKSEESIGPDSWRRLLHQVVMQHGDWSVVEHCSVSVDALVDRGITHEIVRHRIASYTQESTRFVRYFKEKAGDIIQPACFIYPKPDIECEFCLSGKDDEKVKLDVHTGEYRHWVDHLANCAYDFNWLSCVDKCESQYQNLLAKGWRPQEARSVFPNALASRIIITMNLRTWRHFFIMRTSAEAHPQMKQVTIPLLREFQSKIPMLYDDITPEEKQSEAMKKAR